MKKIFFTLAVFVMAFCANAQTNQYFWYNGNLMMGNPIAQIDSVTFGEGEPVDTLHIMLPRTIIKTVHDTVYITIHDTICPDEGAINGFFSVSPTKKVRFSKGNLQYQASTGTWRFAENQFDMAGYDNANISDTYDGWIDLFGWGTGNNPTLSSTNNSNYTTFIDWGTNSISNAGNKENLWRTPTHEDWQYIFNTRPNAAILRGQATVNNIKGLVLLPDSWQTPEGMEWIAMPNNWTTNQYSSEQWVKMEENGAVFMPCSGYRVGTTQMDFQQNGGYWSSVIKDATHAYEIGFNGAEVGADYPSSIYVGQSVRLVQDIK